MSFAQRDGTVAEWGTESEFLTLFPTFFPSSLRSAPFVNCRSFLCYLYAESILFLSFGGSRHMSAEQGKGKGRDEELCLGTRVRSRPLVALPVRKLGVGEIKAHLEPFLSPA